MNVVSLLSEMVSIDTVNSNISGRPKAEEPLVGLLESYAERSRFSTHRLSVPGQSDELLILYERDPSLPWLLFDSHLDTVSVEGMSIDPFAATVSDGRLWGRGACDTKGSGAAMYVALERYAESGGGSNNVMLLYSVDEEQGMSGIRAFTQAHLVSLKRDIVGVIVGEPTRLRDD